MYLCLSLASMASFGLMVPLALQLWLSLWFVRRRGVIIDVPEGAVPGSRAIVSLPDDGSARHATVTIAFPPGISTGQELTVALEV